FPQRFGGARLLPATRIVKRNLPAQASEAVDVEVRVGTDAAHECGKLCGRYWVSGSNVTAVPRDCHLGATLGRHGCFPSFRPVPGQRRRCAVAPAAMLAS